MGIGLPIVVYTHTDMKDIWPMFFGQFKKYLENLFYNNKITNVIFLNIFCEIL